MKSIFLALLVLMTFAFASYGQAPRSATFPVVGSTYDVVTAAPDTFETTSGPWPFARVKVLEAGSDGWFRVEYYTSTRGGSKREICINFPRLVSAEEIIYPK